MESKIKVNGWYVKFLVAFCFFFTPFVVFSQSYVGWVTQAANLRAGPGTNYAILETLPAGTQIFIYSTTGENDFFEVKVLITDTDGYISKSLIKLGDIVWEIPEEESPIGKTGGKTKEDPQIKIFNNTSKRLTLSLNGEKYIFTAQESKTITVPAGKYKYMASVPGVMPYFGNDNLEKYTEYGWTFYISGN